MPRLRQGPFSLPCAPRCSSSIGCELGGGKTSWVRQFLLPSANRASPQRRGSLSNWDTGGQSGSLGGHPKHPRLSASHHRLEIRGAPKCLSKTTPSPAATLPSGPQRVKATLSWPRHHQREKVGPLGTTPIRTLPTASRHYSPESHCAPSPSVSSSGSQASLHLIQHRTAPCLSRSPLLPNSPSLP